MKISKQIAELNRIRREHGDLQISGAHVPGHPEMTIHGIHYVAPGPLLTASPHNRQEQLPARFLIEWKVP
ncbi:MAG: hypothetical protein ABSC03_12395 [Verrucomicrobiota bacterium]|jgi:hypothetical protein